MSPICRHRFAWPKKGLSAKTDNLTDEPSAASAASADGPPTYKEYREQVIARAEREYLENLLRLSNGDIARACEHAGLSPSRLYALLQKHELKARKDASPPPSSKPTRRGAS